MAPDGPGPQDGWAGSIHEFPQEVERPSNVRRWTDDLLPWWKPTVIRWESCIQSPQGFTGRGARTL